MKKILPCILVLLFCAVCFLRLSAQGTNISPGTTFIIDSSTDVAVDGNLINAGTVANSGILDVSGNWANTGTSPVGGTVNLSGTVLNITGQTNFSNTSFNGGSTQIVADLSAITTPSDMGNLTVSNSNGVLLGSNLYASQSLNMGGNILATNSYSMQLGADATTSNTTGYVLGNLQKTFNTGNQNFDFIVGTANGYSPATVAFNNVSNTGSLTVNATQTYEPHAQVPADVLNRYWTLATSGGLAYDYFNINLNYLSLDFNGNPFVQSTMEAHMRGAAYNPNWNYPTVGTRVFDDGPTGSIQLLNLSSTGDFTAATPNITGNSNLYNNSSIPIWSYEDVVVIDLTRLPDAQSQIEIYNILGQKLCSDVSANGVVYRKEVPDIQAGYIVVSVKNNDEIVARKLFITNMK